MGESGYLTISQVRDRLIAAGYHDSTQTIRRLLTDRKLGEEGVDWYRTERGGYRMVSPEAVDRLIAERRRKSSDTR
ncbi:hypothetical protein [Micromonospora sp. NPDC005299]|uniref:hypothetical protein n=1 Tax=Micromonospora sp. NPDC005299 TaxID=3364231 RepID=UPI00369A51FA